MSLKFNPGFWPTPNQKLFIEAALGEKDTAINAWQEWRMFNDLESLDEGSYRLIPLIYKNLDNFIQDDPIWINFKEIYFNFWKLNEILINGTKEIIGELIAADIEITLLKGLPLIKNYYIDSALRPMGDIDILVPKEKFSHAIEILNMFDWKHQQHKDQMKSIKRFFHSIDFVSPLNYHLDLHWQIIPGVDSADFKFIDLDNSNKDFSVPLQVLIPTDELFHVCVHGAQWHRIPSIRWIVDANQILNLKKDSIDWSRIINLANDNSLTLQIRDTFIILDELFNDLIPKSVFLELLSSNTRIGESLQYFFITNPVPVIWGIFDKLFNFNRMNNEKSLLKSMKNFILYLKMAWGRKSSENILFLIIQLIYKRIKLDIFTPPYFKRKYQKIDFPN